MQNIKSKIENRIDELKSQVNQSELPDYSDYDELIKYEDGLQREITKWSQELITHTKLFSKVQSELLYIKELERSVEANRAFQEEIGSSLPSYQNSYLDLIRILRRRIKSCEHAIDASRSLQTHIKNSNLV